MSRPGACTLSAEEAARLPLAELWERLREGADLAAESPPAELSRALAARHLEAASLVRRLRSRLLQEQEEQRILRDELTRHEERFASVERAHRAGTLELQAVDRLKSEFVSIVSHELRTPLTAIRGALGLLEGGVLGELPLDMGEMITMARANSERLIRLVNDMLDLDKIESGKMEMSPEWFAAVAVVGQTERELDASLREARVALVKDVAPELRVFGDRDRVAQVLVNLIGNAVKFSPPGETIVVRAAPARSGAARFEVRDRGPGVSKEHLPRLFRKFSQVDASDQRAKGGTGLGLSISKAIVEQHGGTIGVQSEAGEGATFHFELPAGPPAST